ncbi:putative transmembrane protein [Propionibacterium phage Philemon]|uniref:Transmembrane protein n=1 Tax=Propionibacterium phage Philemon TaxID=3141823 RepID=A0AAU6VX76_9VIRU
MLSRGALASGRRGPVWWAGRLFVRRPGLAVFLPGVVLAVAAGGGVTPAIILGVLEVVCGAWYSQAARVGRVLGAAQRRHGAGSGSSPRRGSDG